MIMIKAHFFCFTLLIVQMPVICALFSCAESADTVETWNSNVEKLTIEAYKGHDEVLFGSHFNHNNECIYVHTILDEHKKDGAASISIERATYHALITNTCDALKQRKKEISQNDYKGISPLEQRFLFTQFPQNRAKKALTQLQAHLRTNFDRNPSVHAANTLSQKWYKNDGTSLVGRLPKDISLHIMDLVHKSIPCRNKTQAFMPFTDLLFCYQQTQKSYFTTVTENNESIIVALCYPEKTIAINGRIKQNDAAHTLLYYIKKQALIREKTKKEIMQTYFYIPPFDRDI